MSTSTDLGHETAIGLLAGPEEFARLRRNAQSGTWAERLHHTFLEGLTQDTTGAGHNQLADLALAAAITGQNKWRDIALKAFLNAVHQPARAYVSQEAGCMSLSGVHLAHSLCLATDWLWPVLNRDQREAAVSALIAYGAENLTPMPDGIRDESDGRGRLLFVRRLDPEDPFCLHPQAHQRNNWDMWFAGSLYMIAALAERAFLQEDDLQWGHYQTTGFDLTEERVTRWKRLASEVIQLTLDQQLGQSGDMAEGISYANYGGSALIIALLALERTGGPNLFTERVFNLPIWQLNQIWPSGAVNFNDAKRSTEPALQNLALLAWRSQDPQLQGLLQTELTCRPVKPSGLLLIGCDPDIPAKSWQPPSHASYPHTGTVVWRAQSDGLQVALQSGQHGGAHQHQDRNQFFLATDREPLLVDTGDCRYLQSPYPAFSETISHNCLLIDGQGQTGTNQAPTHGRLVESAATTALMDAGDCYPGMSHVFRRVLRVDEHALVIADRVDGPAQHLTWLAQGYNGDGEASWHCQDRQLVFKRPRAHLYLFFLQKPLGAAVAVGPLDGEPAGILRLSVEVSGCQCLVVCLLRGPNDVPPHAEWSNDQLQITTEERRICCAQHTGNIAVNDQTYTC